MSLSPKKLNFKSKRESAQPLLGQNRLSRRNRFNIKEVVYTESPDSYRQPNKSVMQILKENNDENILKKELTLFDNFEFPK